MVNAPKFGHYTMRSVSIYATSGSKDGLYSEALARYAHQGGEDLAQRMARYNS